MKFETDGFWKPKIYRHEGVPSYEELTACLTDLEPQVSRSTFAMFKEQALMSPADRIAEALATVIGLLRRAPHLVENRDNTEIFARVMTAEEYASFCEVAGVTTLSQQTKRVVEELLCLRERGTLAFFLSKMFVNLPTDHLCPLDGEE